MLYEQFKKEYLPVALELEKITKTYPKSKQPQYADHTATFESTNLKKKIIELVWATMSTKPFQMKREDIDFFDVPHENIAKNISTFSE